MAERRVLFVPILYVQVSGSMVSEEPFVLGAPRKTTYNLIEGRVWRGSGSITITSL